MKAADEGAAAAETAAETAAGTAAETREAGPSRALREAAEMAKARRAAAVDDEDEGEDEDEEREVSAVAEPPPPPQQQLQRLGAAASRRRAPGRRTSSYASDLSKLSPRSGGGMAVANAVAAGGDLSAYSSGSEGEGAFLGPSAYDYYGAEDLVRRQKDRVVSIILGNLFTLGILGLVYFNYVLFESYIGVFLYAFLASEALWETKRSIVDCLVLINDENTISPRNMLEYAMRTARETVRSAPRWAIALALAFLMPVILLEPLLMMLLVLALAALALFVYLLDRRALFFFRMHRFVLNDSTFVALVLILFILVLGVVCTTLFVVFAFHDVKVMLQMIQAWAGETLMNSRWAQDVWNEVSGHGENALDAWLGDFEHQYVTNTTWEPAFRWVVRFMEETRLAATNDTSAPNATCLASNASSLSGQAATAACSLSAAEASLFGAPASQGAVSMDDTFLMADGWFSIPDWMQNRSLQEILQMVAEHTKSTDLSGVTDKVRDVALSARDGFWTSTIFTMSVLFLVIDFGVRVMFFVTITFILLSSEDNLMHEVLTGIFSSEAQDATPTDPVPAGGNAFVSASEPLSATGSAPAPAASPARAGGPPGPPPSHQRRSAFVERIIAVASSTSESSRSVAECEDDPALPMDDEDLDADSELGTLSPSAGPVAESSIAPEERASDIYLLEQQLRATMEAVVMLTVKMSFYRATATLVLFKIMGIQLPYLAALFTIALTLFPVVYAYWACLPWCLIFALNGHWYLSLLLFSLQYILSFQLDSWVLGTFQKKVQQPSTREHADQSKNEFMTGMSMFFGVTAFGAHGVILGPLLVCLGIVSYNTLKNTQQSVRGIQPLSGTNSLTSSLTLGSASGTVGSLGPGTNAPANFPIHHGIQRTWSTDTPASRPSRRRRNRGHRRSDSETHLSSSKLRPHGAYPFGAGTTLPDEADNGGAANDTGHGTMTRSPSETSHRDAKADAEPVFGLATGNAGEANTLNVSRGRRHSDYEGSSLSTASSTSSFCAVKSFDTPRDAEADTGGYRDDNDRDEDQGEDAEVMRHSRAQAALERQRKANEDEETEGHHQRRSSEPTVRNFLNFDSDDATEGERRSSSRQGYERGKKRPRHRDSGRERILRGTDVTQGRRSFGGFPTRTAPLAHTSSFRQAGRSARLRRHHTASGETSLIDSFLGTVINATTTRNRPPSGGTLQEMLSRRGDNSSKMNGGGMGVGGGGGGGGGSRRRLSPSPEERLLRAQVMLEKKLIKKEQYDEFAEKMLAELSGA